MSMGMAILGAARTLGTIMQITAIKRRGKYAQELANARAAMERKRAEAVKRQAEEKARILEEKRRRLIAVQKVGFAASNVRMNIGSPLIVEAETNLEVTKDKGFILEMGRRAEEMHLLSAAYERTYGKMAYASAKWEMMTKGLLAIGKLGMSDSSTNLLSGLFSRTQPTTAKTGLSSSGGEIFNWKTQPSDYTRNFPASSWG